MSKPKWSDINLHLLLIKAGSLPSKARLVFSPRMWGNLKLYRIKDEVDEKFLCYRCWDEDVEKWTDEELKVDIGPIVAAARLFRRAYENVPFFKKAAKIIVHNKRANLSREQFFELARTIEDLVKDDPDFQNLIVRDCIY